jgi:hypothetical protein
MTLEKYDRDPMLQMSFTAGERTGWTVGCLRFGNFQFASMFFVWDFETKKMGFTIT